MSLTGKSLKWKLNQFSLTMDLFPDLWSSADLCWLKVCWVHNIYSLILYFPEHIFETPLVKDQPPVLSG